MSRRERLDGAHMVKNNEAALNYYLRSQGEQPLVRALSSREERRRKQRKINKASK